MKILHITPAYYPATYWGGPIFSVYALNNALARLSDVSLRVLATDSSGPLLKDRLDTASLVGLYPNQKVIMTRRVAGACVSLELLQKLPGLVRWADVVHLTGTYSFPTIPTLVVCRVFDKPVVWSPRGAVQDAHEWEGSRRRRLKRVWEWICNALIVRGKVVTHTTSERERIATQERLPRPTAMIVPNGVYVPDILPGRDWLPGGRLRLMYLGRLSPKKGIENLLHAIKRMNDSSVLLTIYGTGDVVYTESLKKLTGALGLLGKSAIFAGHVDGEAKSAAFHAADLCVVPSFTENFCGVVAESLAHGVPVIASRGTPWEGVEEKGCGLWVGNSPESLFKAITKIRVMDLPGMGARGRDWMRAEYDWSAIAASMQRIYRGFYADA